MSSSKKESSKKTPQLNQQSDNQHSQALNLSNLNSQLPASFVKASTYKQKSQKRSHIQLQMSDLQGKLFHQIILKGQNWSQQDIQKQIIKKMSQDVKQNLQQVLLDIHKLQAKFDNPLLNHYQKQEIRQQILSKRMTELANVKVLVGTYKHNQYRLILTEFHISRSYQDLKCHQQAVTHLESAVMRNQQFRVICQGKSIYIYLDSEYFHSHLLSLLALSYFALQEGKQSLEVLNQALQINQKLKNQGYPVRQFFSLHLVAKVLSFVGNQADSISIAKQCIETAQKNYQRNSTQTALGYKILAQSQLKTHQYDEALNSMKTAIEILQLSSPQQQDSIIEFYQKQAQMTLKRLKSLQENDQKTYLEQYLNTLRKKYQVIQNAYGYRDKRSIRDKRHLAISYIDYLKMVQAEQQLEDILETVYGQKSVEVAKTLKFLGTVAMSQNQIKKAQKYLKKSQGIFHDQGFTKQQKQVQTKLLKITGNAKFLMTSKV